MAAIDFPNSPTNGQVFASGTLSWTYQTGIGWLLNAATTGTGGFNYVQDAMPTATAPNQTWFETDTGNSYVWFNDGNSSQWVQFAPGGGGGASGFTFIQDTVPTGMLHGSTWHDSSTGISYVYVVDANSSQWVQFAPGIGGTGPRGVLRAVQSANGGADQSVGGSEIVLCAAAPLTHTITVEANRWTRWTMSISGIAANAGGSFAVILYIDGTVNHVWRRVSSNISHVVETLISRQLQLAAGSHTITFGVVAYVQNYTVACWNYQQVFVTAEDIGPVTT